MFYCIYPCSSSDPFAKRRNVASTVSHSHVFEYIYDRLRAAFHYFGVPQTTGGPAFTKVDTRKLEQQLCQEYISRNKNKNEEDAQTSPKKPVDQTTLVAKAHPLKIKHRHKKGSKDHAKDTDSCHSSSAAVNAVIDATGSESTEPAESEAEASATRVSPEAKPTEKSPDTSLSRSDKDCDQPVVPSSSNQSDMTDEQKLNNLVQSITSQVLSASIKQVQALENPDGTPEEGAKWDRTSEANHLEQLFANLTVRQSSEEGACNQTDETGVNSENYPQKAAVRSGSSSDESGNEASAEESEDDGLFDLGVLTELKPEDFVFKFDASSLCDGKVRPDFTSS